MNYMKEKFKSIFEYKTTGPSRFIACAGGIVLIALVYWQLLSHEFINFDDNLYITENAVVKNGLTIEGISWAFTNINFLCWQPVTWLSHMLDSEIFSQYAGGHHLISMLIHILNCMILFMLLWEITFEFWKSLLVAAFLGLHPVSVESVAWAAERKNVLSTFFWLLTLYTYYLYVKKPAVIRYAASLFSLILALMTKPMAVTIPFTLLIFDFWPIQRINNKSSTINFTAKTKKRERRDVVKKTAWVLILEKLPFFIILVGYLLFFSVFIQKVGGVYGTDRIPIFLRIENSLVVYVKYLTHVFWPLNLSVYYPYPEFIPFWQVMGAGVIILGISIFFITKSKTFPYMISGWFWYLGTLFPVIGLIQSGLWPEMADRWAYVPLIGIYIILAWGIIDLANRFRMDKLYHFCITTGLMIILSIAAYQQTGYWKNSVTIFKRAVNVTDNNYIAHDNLGLGLVGQGKTDLAHYHFSEALRIRPDYPKGHQNVGVYYLLKGETDRAILHFKKSLKNNPTPERIFNNLGRAFLQKGNINQAIEQFNLALIVKPGYISAKNNLQKAMVLKRTENVFQATGKSKTNDHNFNQD